MAASLSSRTETRRLSHADSIFPDRNHPRPFAFNSPSPRIATGNTGACVCFTSRPIPGLNGRKLPRIRPCSFGKHQHVVTAIHCFARMGKAPLKIPPPRKGKDVVERSQQPICRRTKQHEAPRVGIAEVAEVLQHFASIAAAIQRRMRPGSAYSTSAPSYAVMWLQMISTGSSILSPAATTHAGLQGTRQTAVQPAQETRPAATERASTTATADT